MKRSFRSLAGTALLLLGSGGAALPPGPATVPERGGSLPLQRPRVAQRGSEPGRTLHRRGRHPLPPPWSTTSEPPAAASGRPPMQAPPGNPMGEWPVRQLLGGGHGPVLRRPGRGLGRDGGSAVPGECDPRGRRVPLHRCRGELDPQWGWTPPTGQQMVGRIRIDPNDCNRVYVAVLGGSLSAPTRSGVSSAPWMAPELGEHPLPEQ